MLDSFPGFYPCWQTMNMENLYHRCSEEIKRCVSNSNTASRYRGKRI